jgi:hypothetical protein
MQTIALFGAAGKMGTRIANKLKESPGYQVLYVEAGEAAQALLRQRGQSPTPADEAAQQADTVVLAVPDKLIGKVAEGVVPLLKPGAMVVCLDPAAPFGGELPQRADITYFIVHPCHPPVVNDETDPEARMDFFGAVKAKQNAVAALMQGHESDYARGEALVRAMFAPVMNVHRVTVEQMAILEPALSETVALTCMMVIVEAMDEAVRRGVPPQAVRDFMLGHINVNIGILFGFLPGVVVSDGARMAAERGRKATFQPDWKKVFEPDAIMHEVKSITQGISLKGK